MLQLAKKTVTSTYRVTDHVRSGEISVAKDPAAFDGDGPDLQIVADVDPDGRTSGYRVVVEGATAVTATDLGERLRGVEFAVTDGGVELQLRKPSGGLNPFTVVAADGTEAGRVVIGKLTGRKLKVEVDDALGFELRLLLGWLAMRHWNAAANVGIAL